MRCAAAPLHTNKDQRAGAALEQLAKCSILVVDGRLLDGLDLIAALGLNVQELEQLRVDARVRIVWRIGNLDELVKERVDVEARILLRRASVSTQHQTQKEPSRTELSRVCESELQCHDTMGQLRTPRQMSNG